jgi:hypothetical protein
MTYSDDLDAPDLRHVAERLEAARPRMTSLELDATKQRIRARSATPARMRTKKGTFMRSRLATMSVLVLGAVLSTGGTGLAIGGFASSDNAAVAQYGTPTPTPSGGGQGGVLGEQEQGGQGGQGGGQGGVAGEQAGGGPSGAQPERQVEAGVQSGGSSQLPFTGFAAIPIILLGLVMTVTGVVMRRRTGPQD